MAELGKYDEALAEFDEVLPLYEEIYGENHIYTAAREVNVGVVYYHLGKLRDAMRYFRAALTTYQAVQATDEETLQAKAELENNMAAVYIAQGKVDEAETHLQEALADLPATGQELYRVLFLKALGYVKWQQGDKAAARSLWEQAATLAHRALGEDHAFTQECDNYLKLSAQ